MKFKLSRAKIAVILLAAGTIAQNPRDLHVVIGSIATVIAAFTGAEKKPEE